MIIYRNTLIAKNSTLAKMNYDLSDEYFHFIDENCYQYFNFLLSYGLTNILYTLEPVIYFLITFLYLFICCFV